MRQLWTIGEFTGDDITPTTSEVLGMINKISDVVTAETCLVLVGSELLLYTPIFARLGQPLTILIESEDFKNSEPGLIAREIADHAISRKPTLIAVPFSQWGQEVAARIASRLCVPLVTDVVGAEVKDNQIVVERLAFGGQMKVKVLLPEMAVLTVHGHIFTPPRPADITASIERLQPALSVSEIRKILERVEPLKSEGPLLADAQIIVTGGRGMGSPENFELVKKLASKLGAAYGASRAIVDSGWVDASHQVGLTGKVVSPRLYIACGVSGADQHLAGMRTSDIVVAINRDPDAPIFKIASFGIVGDCVETLKALLENLG
jgi:electron transfer flavoprotein alpha subunit